MSKNIKDIINVDIITTGGGIGYTNYGVGLVIVPSTDTVSGLADKFRGTVFPDTVDETFTAGTDANAMCKAWFSQQPSPRSLDFYVTTTDLSISANVSTVLTEAAATGWFFYPFFAVGALDAAGLSAAGAWCTSNRRMFLYSENHADSLTGGAATLARGLLSSNSKYVAKLSYYNADQYATNKINGYPHVNLAARFAAVDYNGFQSTVTGDNIRLKGLAGSMVNPTQLAAMKDDYITYNTVASGGSVSKSVYATDVQATDGSWIDSTIHFEVLAAKIEADTFNFIKNAEKAPSLTARGYASILTAVKVAGRPFYQNANGLLGAGYYTHPVTGAQEYTDTGYVVINTPEDIYKLTTAQREARQAYPITVIALDAGGVQQVNISLIKTVSEVAL